MAKSSVAIIGAGPGGLATAMLLASAGVKVRLFERGGAVGGRCSAIIADGFRFDRGPTFFLYPSVLESIFASVGRDLWSEAPMVKLDPQYQIVFGSGGRILATPDIEKLRAEIARFSAHDAGAIQRFMADNRRKLALFKPCLEAPFSSVADVLTLRMLKLLPALRPWNSLDRELGRYFSDPRIRLAFSFQSKYLGMSPFQCPSLFSILSFLEYEHGVFHPIGGCSAVCDAMERVLREMDVDIHLHEPAKRILFDGRRAVGIETETDRYQADAVVINADFAAAMTQLIPDRLRPRWSDAKLARKKYSCSTFMLYLGLDGPPRDVPHHTIYLSSDYRQNLLDIEKLHRLSDDPSIYVQNACVTDPSLAPRGKHTLYILSPVTHEHPNVDWAAQAAGYREKVLARVEQLGFTDLRRRIVFQRMTTPADWASFGPIYRGATFNLAHTLNQMLHLRPHNRFEGVDGVYLVGGGTHPGSGLPVIFESARISARLLLEDFGLSLPRAAGRPAVPMEAGA